MDPLAAVQHAYIYIYIYIMYIYLSLSPVFFTYALRYDLEGVIKANNDHDPEVRQACFLSACKLKPGRQNRAVFGKEELRG